MYLFKPKILFALFLIAFLIKFTIASYLRYLLACGDLPYRIDDIPIQGSDTYSYFGAMENYIQNGEYSFFNGVEVIKAGRLPHYSFLYYFLRRFFSIGHTHFFIVIFQIAVECIAYLYLGILAFKITRKKLAFYLTYFLFLLSLFTSYYSQWLTPDSLSVSFLIIFLYYFIVFLETNSLKRLFLSGFILAAVVSIKPHFSLIYIPIGVILLLKSKNENSEIRKIFSSLSYKVLIVSISVILLITPWALRNYNIYHKFVPFQVNILAGYNYTNADLACRRFLHGFGEDWFYWEKHSAGHYFMTPNKKEIVYKFPDYAFTKAYNYQNLEAIRIEYLSLLKNYSKAADEKVAVKFDKLTAAMIKERPFQYYFLSRFIGIKTFIFHNGSFYLPIIKESICYRPWQQLIIVCQSVLYWITLIIGFLGLFLLYRKDQKYFMILFLPIFLIIFFPLTFRWVEERYFLQAYPVLLLGLVYVVVNFMSKLLSPKAL